MASTYIYAYKIKELLCGWVCLPNTVSNYYRSFHPSTNASVMDGCHNYMVINIFNKLQHTWRPLLYELIIALCSGGLQLTSAWLLQQLIRQSLTYLLLVTGSCHLERHWKGKAFVLEVFSTDKHLWLSNYVYTLWMLLHNNACKVW